jgi:precorrin-3B synthase
VPPTSTVRSRPDLCPGVFRPWSAADGALVRLRLVGGRISPASLVSLSRVAEEYGDGDVHLTRRANLQLRGLPSGSDGLTAEVIEAIASTGLLPFPSHELVRNVMVSPQTGLSGGRADLGPVAAELDGRLCADPALAALPGRFLFVLDDGRGDLAGRSADLGLVVLDERTAQLRVGSSWGPVVPVTGTAGRLADLATRFLDARGSGPEAAWHVDELASPLLDPVAPEEAALVRSPPLAYGTVGGGEHVAAPDGRLDGTLARQLAARDRELVVTPWRGVLVPATGDER